MKKEDQFQYIDSDEILGKHVRYSDYVGEERFGIIVATEPYPYDTELVYVYIEDEIGDKNEYQDWVNGRDVRYAAIKLSSEVVIDDEM